MKLRKMKKRKARELQESLLASIAITPAAAEQVVTEDASASSVDTSGTPGAEMEVDAEAREREADERVEIAEAMYRAAAERAEIAEVREREAADRAEIAETMYRAAAERAEIVEAKEKAAAERVEIAETMHSAALARAAAVESKELAAAERAAAVEAREKAAAERDAIANTRDKAAVERDSIANSRDKAAVERDSIAVARLSPGRETGSDVPDDAALERARLEAELQRAHLDALTGVFRREIGRLALRNEIERARRADGKFVIAFIDVDGLKGVNDREGHAAGDRILRTLAATMRANLRSYDPIVRFGGDEFICGISSIDTDEVQHRISVIDQSMRHATGVGITAGLAALTANESLDELTATADAALIEAKRNRSE